MVRSFRFGLVLHVLRADKDTRREMLTRRTGPERDRRPEAHIERTHQHRHSARLLRGIIIAFHNTPESVLIALSVSSLCLLAASSRQTAHNLYLCFDLCTGGELFDRICAKGNYYEACVFPPSSLPLVSVYLREHLWCLQRRRRTRPHDLQGCQVHPRSWDRPSWCVPVHSPVLTSSSRLLTFTPFLHLPFTSFHSSSTPLHLIFTHPTRIQL